MQETTSSTMLVCVCVNNKQAGAVSQGCFLSRLVAMRSDQILPSKRYGPVSGKGKIAVASLRQAVRKQRAAASIGARPETVARKHYRLLTDRRSLTNTSLVLVSVTSTLLPRKGPVGRQAFRARNQGVESIFCRWVAGCSHTSCCFCHRHRYCLASCLNGLEMLQHPHCSTPLVP